MFAAARNKLIENIFISNECHYYNTDIQCDIYEQLKINVKLNVILKCFIITFYYDCTRVPVLHFGRV